MQLSLKESSKNQKAWHAFKRKAGSDSSNKFSKIREERKNAEEIFVFNRMPLWNNVQQHFTLELNG